MALPSGLSGIAVRMARLLPESVLRVVLPRRLRFRPAAQVASPDPAAKPIRIFIGPVNFAGQGWQWSRAVERARPDVSAVSMEYSADGGYRFPIDDPVPASTYLMSRRWQKRQREVVADRFTHVIVEAGKHLFGNVYGESVAHEIRWLRARGVAVAMLTHGSDMRSPERHAERHPFSPFTPGEWTFTDQLIQETRRNRALLDEVRTPIFVSTPGMLADVPEGRWIPVVVDPARWATVDPPLRGVPLVVHAPSNPVIKGTALIEPMLQRLVDEGLIRYERLQGVPASEMPARFREADIVLDQFRLGDYGVAACEALAAGRVVIGNVDADVRRFVADETGLEVPILEADPATLESVLRGIVADPEPARRVAAAGPAFVAAVHTGPRSARVLADFLGDGSTA